MARAKNVPAGHAVQLSLARRAGDIRVLASVAKLAVPLLRLSAQLLVRPGGARNTQTRRARACLGLVRSRGALGAVARARHAQQRLELAGGACLACRGLLNQQQEPDAVLAGRTQRAIACVRGGAVRPGCALAAVCVIDGIFRASKSCFALAKRLAEAPVCAGIARTCLALTLADARLVVVDGAERAQRAEVRRDIVVHVADLAGRTATDA